MDAKRNDASSEQTPFSAPVPSYTPTLSEDTIDPDIPGAADRVKLDNEETSYTDPGHWTSILDGISELRESLDQIRIAPQALHTKDVITGPDLLFGGQRHATQQEILASVPPRSEADQLIIKYYAYMDMAPTILHRPTFLREYDRFWEDPAQTPVMWLGLLFALFGAAIHFQTVLDESDPQMHDPDYSSIATARMDFYREKVVQCLVLANYAKGPPYTMETLLSYFVLEYLRSRDTQSGVWLVVGIIVRTAFKMGYHREPSRFPNISPFKAEMRRRMWTMIVRLDLMSSTAVGLPRMIQPSTYDIMQPRNLIDEDLDEDMTELPPSRPDSESTALLYTVVRDRGLAIFARIMDLSNNTEPSPYREILEHDSALREQYETIPSVLKCTKETIFDATSEVIMRRLYLSLTLLKGSIMLHRPYMILGRTDSRYEYSRIACLDAALEVLDFQKMLERESMPDGKLHSTKWRLWTSSWRYSPLINQDFLLAATVLILDLDKDIAMPLSTPQNNAPRVRFKSGQPSRAEIVETLSSSYPIWCQASETSQEAAKMVAALKLVLSKANADGIQLQSTPSPSQQDALAFLAQRQLPNALSDPADSTAFFDINNPHFSIPFPIGDMPIDFGSSHDWTGLGSDYSMPFVERDLPTSYFG